MTTRGFWSSTVALCRSTANAAACSVEHTANILDASRTSLLPEMCKVISINLTTGIKQTRHLISDGQFMLEGWLDNQLRDINKEIPTITSWESLDEYLLNHSINLEENNK